MSHSDNDDKPRTDIISYLPEVYRSEINQSIFETSFNRFLTKDDTTHVAGFVGQGNPNALIKRRIPEQTPQRQAFQLQPTMYTQVGNVQYVVSFKNFQKQLELMGVDFTRMQQWGNALEFNFAPPIDFDKLVNFRDYYWSSPDDLTAGQQYFTIENRCKKQQVFLDAFNQLIFTYGDTFPIISMDVVENSLTVAGLYSSLFTAGFQFYINNTTDPNIANRYMFVESSIFDAVTNTTKIILESTFSQIAIHSTTAPVTTVIGRYWVDTTDDSTYRWDGSSWVLFTPLPSGDISLVEIQINLQKVVNCTCSGDVGWDMALWDDNVGNWTAALGPFNQPTEAAWISANGAPTPGALWFDTTNDILFQRNSINTTWVSVITNFSIILAQANAGILWDLTESCNNNLQTTNQWTDQNRWIHKSEVTSFVGVRRAQVPIIEYDARTELNEWTQLLYTWKYRAGSSGSFSTSTTAPHRLELEPIKGYQAIENPPLSGNWYLYLFHKNTIESRDIDYSSIFVPGYSFRIVDDNTLNDIYTVDFCEYRETGPSDPSTVQSGYFTTIVKITQNAFVSPLVGGGVNNTRIIPQVTTKGDVFRGYHVHWLLDTSEVSTIPVGSQTENPILQRAKTQGVPYSFSGQTVVGITSVGDYYEEITVASATTSIALDTKFRYHTTNTLTVIGVTPGLAGNWVVSGNHTSLFDINTSFVITNNTGGGNGIYTTQSVFFNGSDTEITVNELIPSSSTPTGIISTGMHSYVLANNDDLRVYINGIRQYGTYTEVSAVGNPGITIVGTSAYSIETFDYVTGIVFLQPLAQFDVVRIEVGSASLVDMGLSSVPVRTIEDETAFSLAVAAGTQPPYKNLAIFKKTEQVKNQLNQYPLFNVYDVCTGEVVKASPIFAYTEDPQRDVDASTQRRIIITDGGREYQFTQFLLKADDEEIYGYRLLNNGTVSPTNFWFNPKTNILKRWDGKTWQSNFVIQDTITGQFVVRTPFVGISPPQSLVSLVNSIWYDTKNKVVNLSNGVTWLPIAYPEFDNPSNAAEPQGLFIEGGDPTLSTVWRGVPQYQSNTSGPSSTWSAGVYVPQWVDGDRTILPVGDPTGDWEVPEQWRFNPEHEIKANVSYSELVTHFLSVIKENNLVFSTTSGFRPIYAKAQAEIDYSLGGIIKEYNDSYDTLMSVVNQRTVSPLTVIDFARTQYASLISIIKEFFNKSAVSLLTNLTTANIVDPGAFAASQIILEFEENDFYGQVFYDSSSFDGVNGIRHWVATVPMFGLGFKRLPYINVDDHRAILEVSHHDGHRSMISLTAAEEDALSRQIVNTIDPRTNNLTFGVISSSAPPSTFTAFQTAFVSSRTGVFWYRTGTSRVLYRFAVIAITPIPPPFTDASGNVFPDGVFYYDSAGNTLYEKVGLAWQPVTSIGDGIISAAWIPVDFRAIQASLILDIEQKLYAVAPTYEELVFDFDSLTPNNSEQAFFDQYMKDQFLAFVNERQIIAPFENLTYNAADPFTWNYNSSVVTTPPTLFISLQQAASWQSLYTKWYGTPYPHLEPWKLQGYGQKPDWWDAQYLNDDTLTYGNRRWKYVHSTQTGMWENIRVGMVPVGRLYPDGTVSSGNSIVDGQTLPTYNYFSVNIDDVVVSGGYAPDDVFPPFYNTSSSVIRSIFTNFNAEIIAPSANYVYGDGGPVEWLWTVSDQHVYDPLTVAFRMQPVRFMHYAFGPQFIRINNLQVEDTFCQVYSHTDALFHGDIFNTNETYKVRGLNQWYVNYNRFVGFDTNKDFRALWVDWSPQLTYQFDGIIDTNTLEVTNKYYDVVPQDYNIVVANDGAIKDFWVDAFNVTVLSMPPAIIQYNNQSLWKLEVNTLADVPRALNFYGVKRFPFVVDISNNIATIFQFVVTNVSASSKLFEIDGDHQFEFTANITFTVSNSSQNDGTYTVASSVYDSSLNKTNITVFETIPSSVANGIIDIDNQIIPWNTGDPVFLSSTKLMPAPLEADLLYYIIKVNNRQFQIADSLEEANLGSPITFITTGSGDLNIAQVDTTFEVLGGASLSNELWYHYALDKSVVRTLTPPYTVAGIQTLINILDGYKSYQQDTGVLFNLGEGGEIDPQTGRMVSWQLEIERFIDWAYKIRRSNTSISDRFDVMITNLVAGELKFINNIPAWTSGTQVVMTTTGTLPAPILPNTPYYYVPSTTPGMFKLSVSQNVTPTSIVTFSSSGSGTIKLGLYQKQIAFPTFEINPTRNNIWIDTPQGVLSDIIVGPYADIRIQQTIFDQYNRPLTRDKLLTFRQDKQSRIMIRQQLTNDVELSVFTGIDPYNYLHIGGGHFFVEGYEHVVIFNDYTVGGDLIYDPFLGLNTPKFDLDFFEKNDHSLRPTLGGYYLFEDKFNRNIEGQVVDVQQYYDTVLPPENTETSRRVRNLLGYRGHSNFLDLLNTNAKSQFIFYKGMIQEKGSVNSINAYINSRRFVDAQIDEYWAWKIAEFGDIRPKVYPEIRLFSEDGTLEDVRLEFLTDSEATDTVQTDIDEQNGFQLVTFQDDSRWVNFPEQKTLLNNSILFLDAEVSSVTKYYSAPSTQSPISGQESQVDYWYETDTDQLKIWNGIAWVAIGGRHKLVGNNLFLKLDAFSDQIRVAHRILTKPSGYQDAVFTSPIEPTNPTGLANDSTVYTTTIVFNGLITKVVNIVGSQAQTFGEVFQLIFNQISLYGNVFVDQGPLSGQFSLRFSSILQGSTSSVSVSLGTLFPALVGFDHIAPAVPGVDVSNDLRQYITELLAEGTGLNQYQRVNSSVVSFEINGFDGEILIYTINPAKTKLSPAKIIDYKSDVVLSEVPYWHPARGHHYHIAMHNVTIQNAIDPALYTNTLNPNDVSQRAWNTTELGTVWLDASYLQYLPYYDDVIYPDVNQRLANWGKLAQYGDVRVAQWIRSAVSPEQYDQLVSSQANDNSIPTNSKATGIAKTTVFKRYRESSFSASIVSPPTSVIDAIGHTFQVNDEVLFTASILPEYTQGSITGTLQQGTKYIITSVGADVFEISDDIGGVPFVFTNTGAGLLAIPTFKSSNWIRKPFVTQSFNALIDLTTLFEPAIQLNSQFSVDDVVDVYVNGILQVVSLIVDGSLQISMIGTGLTLTPKDTVVVVRPVPILTADQNDFDPDTLDDGTQSVQFKQTYEFTTVVLLDQNGKQQISYYFWVEQGLNISDVTDSSSLPTLLISQQLKDIPIPYMVVQRPRDDPSLSDTYGYGIIYGTTYSVPYVYDIFPIIPVFYRQAILRNASSIINVDDRYELRFTRDLTLRDNLNDYPSSVNLKNKHEEWVLIRREQQNNIDRSLWDKLTESIVQYKLTDPSVRVPSLERELYDIANKTSTRLGLQDGQAFTDGALALTSVKGYLQDPTKVFYPVDINSFFQTHSFDTPADIVVAMDAIYNSFGTHHVNNIWFDTLLDALSLKSKYREFFKTSWVALHGIRVLEVNGLFDD